MQTLDWNPPQKLVANLTGRSLEGLSRKASQEIEWWVKLPHPTQSRHQQRHTRADVKAQLTRPLLVNITGIVFVDSLGSVLSGARTMVWGKWAEPGEWELARSCFTRNSSWGSGSPIASTRSRELKVFPGNKKSLRRFEFRSWRCRHVTRTVASQYRETQGQQLAHVYSPGCSARQDRIGTRDMSWPAGMVWCRSSHES